MAGENKANAYFDKLPRARFEKIKKRRMRILSARIFSKSFGGKIKPGQTDVNKESTFTKNDITSIAKEPKSYLTS